MIIRSCEHCGALVKVPPSKEGRRTYCSKECFQASRNMAYACATCGAPFVARKVLADRKRFCSRACKDAYPRTLTAETLTCKVCGEAFTRAGEVNRRRATCSAACARIARMQRRPETLQPRVTKPCAICGKPMELFQSRRERRYCSRACQGYAVSQQHRGVIRTSEIGPCLYCGREVRKFQSRLSAARRFFCGSTCYHAWDALYKSTPEMLAKLADRLRGSFGKPSALEDRVADWLTQHGLDFERQVLLKVYTLDFRVGSTFVEVQGCYWHGCGVCNDALTPLQKRRSARDKSLATYCQKRGIPLLIIWEHDIDHGDFSALAALTAQAT